MPVDAFTQQLIDAGLVDDQAQLLAQQMKRGQGLMQTPGATGMNVGGTYVAGNPLEHLSVALSRMMGGRMAHDAQQGLAKGIDTKRAGRTAFAERQSGLPGIPTAEELLAPPAQPQWSPPDLAGGMQTDGVTAPPPTAAQRLASAMEARTKLGQAGVLSGDPIISAGGQGLLGEAKGLGAEGLTVATGNRQHGLEQQKIAQTIAQHQAEQARWLAQQSETARHNRATEGINAKMVGGSLSPEAIDMAAQYYATTGQLPNLGTRQVGPKLQIIERAAQTPGTNIASNKANLKANETSLVNQTKLLDLTKSWEATGKANLGVLRGISQDLVSAGSPLINKPLRWLYQNAGGDPTVSKFHAAHAAVVNEYAKILSGATGSAGVTDAARREAEQMLPLDATPSQIAAAADILETDAGNRLSALAKGVESTRARLSGKEPPVEAPAAATSSSADALRKKYGL